MLNNIIIRIMKPDFEEGGNPRKAGVYTTSGKIGAKTQLLIVLFSLLFSAPLETSPISRDITEERAGSVGVAPCAYPSRFLRRISPISDVQSRGHDNRRKSSTPQGILKIKHQKPPTRAATQSKLQNAGNTLGIIKNIEYRIDTRPVSTPDRLNALEKQTLIAVGEPFSRYAVQRSVVSLYASGQFSQVNVYALDTIVERSALVYTPQSGANTLPSDESSNQLQTTAETTQTQPYEKPEGVVLIFELKSVRRIRELNFLGVPVELIRAIEMAIQSKLGAVYVPAIAKSDVDRIKAACSDYGFFDAEIVQTSALVYTPQSGANTLPTDESSNQLQTTAETTQTQPYEKGAALTYQITLGDASVITELQIQGHSSIATQLLKEQRWYTPRKAGQIPFPPTRFSTNFKRQQEPPKLNLTKKQIEAACELVRVGEIYRTSAVESDIASIRALYRKNNYPAATIEPTFVHQTGVLTLHVDEGRQLLIDFLSEDGKPLVSFSFPRVLLAKLRLIRENYKSEELRNQITRLINTPFMWEKTIQAHFKAMGYDRTAVRWVVLMDTPLKYHVRFTINPGTRYIVTRVTFSGNRAFSNAELLREMKTKPSDSFSQRYRYLSLLAGLIPFRKRFFYEQTLATDIQSLKILYEKAGYPNANVETPHIEKQNPNNRSNGEIEIHLTIVEAHKEVIHRCRFSGNRALDVTTLLDVLPSQPPQPNAPLVRKAYENAVLRAYQAHGYIDAVVSAQYLPETGTPVFQVEGNFSEQLKVGTLSTELPTKLQGEFERHSLTLAGTFIATEIGNRRWIIQDVQGNARYTLKQELTHLAVFEHGVLHLEIAEGQQVVFGEFYFAGDPGVKQHVLTREVTHLQGTLFTPAKLSRVVQNLYNSGIFQPGIHWERLEPHIQTSALVYTPQSGANTLPTNQKTTAETTQTEPYQKTSKVSDVSIRLQKQKPGAYRPSIGYSSSDGLRGTLALSHLNLFKRNTRVRLRGRGGFKGGTLGYLYDITLTEPWLFHRTRGSLQVAQRNLEEDDNVRARQASFTLSRALKRKHLLDLQYSYRDLHDLPVATPSESRIPPDTNLPTTFKTTVSSLRFSWTHDSRLPYINPTSGMLNEATLEYAGGFLGGASSFIKTVADTRYYRKLGDTEIVLATALRCGIITGLRLNRRAELSSFERFWAGGSTTVRGYAERALGPLDSTGKHRGNVQLIFNTELRFPIYEPGHGVLFFDTGNVWESLEEIDYTWRLPSAVGAGLRLNLGPLTGGVDYAVALVSVPGVPKNFFYLRVGSTF